MSNDHVFNKINRPVYSNLTNTYTSPGTMAPPETNAGQTGNLYTVTATNSTNLGLLGGTVTITIQVSNPAGSGKTMYVSRIAGGINVALNLLSSFTGTLTLTSGGTLAAPVALTPFNTRLGSTGTSVMTARSSTSAVTGGTVFFSAPLEPGQFHFEETGRYVVPPGQSFSMTVSGSLTVAGLLSSLADMIWWEA